MWDEDIVIPIAFFATIIITSIGIPLIRALAKKWERQAVAPTADMGRIDDRLSRIEQAIDAMSIEVERIAEGQRFTTRLLAERGSEQPSIESGNERGAKATGMEGRR